MNWRKIRKWVLIIVLGNGLIFGLNSLINKILSPQCFDNILDSAKSSTLIMNRIGGYGGDHSEYSELEIENYATGVPAKFKLRVLGNSGTVTFTGLFRKKDGTCDIIEIDTTYAEHQK